MSQLRLASLFNDTSKRIVEGVVRRSPFPLNVNIVTITELHQAIGSHVNFLKKEREKAGRVREKIDLLKKVERLFIEDLQKTEYLKTFYEKFWEERIPDSLEDERKEVIQNYTQNFEDLREEVDDFSRFFSD